MDQSPTSDYSLEYLAEYCGGRLIAVSVAFIVLEIFFVALRSFARLETSSPRGWDDYLIGPALILNLGTCVVGILMVHFAGVGRHEAVFKDSIGSVLLVWGEYLYALEILYLTAIALSKMSILFLYLRVLVTRLYRIITYVLMAWVTLSCLAFVIAATVGCTPVSYLWNKSIPGGHCVNTFTIGQMANIPSIVSDVIMLILPMPMVWGLRISSVRKFGLTLVFLTGSVGLVSSCIRLSIFINSTGSDSGDTTWDSITPIIWTIVEPGVYMIAACLPALRVLISQSTFTSMKARFVTAPESPFSSLTSRGKSIRLDKLSDPHPGDFTRLGSKDLQPYHVDISKGDECVTTSGTDEGHSRLPSASGIGVTQDVHVTSETYDRFAP
ncbi:hypothetical protein MMC12_007482 [Toensbergia leucococca]|nr:hypothetical protein [Toensbergia leucococca]